MACPKDRPSELPSPRAASVGTLEHLQDAGGLRCSYCSNWVLGEIASKEGNFSFCVSVFYVSVYYLITFILPGKSIYIVSGLLFPVPVFFGPISRHFLISELCCNKFSGPGDSQRGPDCGGVPIGCQKMLEVESGFEMIWGNPSEFIVNYAPEFEEKIWKHHLWNLPRKRSLVMLLNLGVGRWCAGGVQHRLLTICLQKLCIQTWRRESWLVFCACLFWFSFILLVGRQLEKWMWKSIFHPLFN